MAETPALICLHGALGSAAQLEAALQPLKAHAQLHFFDFPGHGSRVNETLTVDNCVAALRDFMLQKQLTGTTLFGYSMGGYVALLFAKRYQELCGQVITLGTKLDWNPHFATQEVEKLNPQIMIEKVPRYAASLEKWHGSDWKKVVTATATMMKDLGASPHFTDDVYQTIQHPVLLCLADGDTMVTREETIHAAWMLPNGEFASIAKSGHPVEKVALEQFWSIISPVV